MIFFSLRKTFLSPATPFLPSCRTFFVPVPRSCYVQTRIANVRKRSRFSPEIRISTLPSYFIRKIIKAEKIHQRKGNYVECIKVSKIYARMLARV